MSDDAKTPAIHERLLWVVVACLAWRFAGIASSVGIYRAGAAGVALVVLATGFGLASLVVATSRRASRWATGPHLFVAFTFFFVLFGLVDSFMRSRTAYTWSTDAHVFSEYAARLLLRGQNPYDASLSGAFAVTRLPIELQTPLVDGGFSDRMAYPSLSFLVLVPFVKLGIDTRLAFAAAVWGCTAVLYFNVPRIARPLVLVPFFADPTYLYFAFGGVTDGVWALLLCFVVVHWQKRDRAALLFGLACCVKQHPWLLAPFLAARLWQETKGDWRALARFFGIGAGVFLLLNGPFILWSANGWLQGVVEPLVRKMVPLGDGPTAFVALAGAPIPKPIFTIAYWGSMALLFFACMRLRAGRVLMWIAPSLAFFLNHRSLSTYWYFNVFPFAVELARADWNELGAGTDENDRSALRRLGLAAGAFFATLAVAAGVMAKNAESGIEVTLDLPMRSWSGRLHRVDLKVTNRSAKPIAPRFWGQSVSFQPLTWRVDEGPDEIAPGATGSYSISTTHTIAEIELERGGTITVTDRDSSLRKSLPIDPDPTALSLWAIPNSGFRFWDVHTGSPTWWALGRSGAAAGRARPATVAGRRGVELVIDSDAQWVRKNELQFCLAIPSCWAESKASALSVGDLETQVDHRVELVADLVDRAQPIAVWAMPPRDANKPPFHEIYGVQLSFGSKDVMVLLGSDAGRGVLPNGMPFESIPGAADAWGRYEIDLAGLRTRHAPDVYPKALPTIRLPFLDLPLIGLRIRLVYSTRSAERRSAVFGTIEDPLANAGRDDREAVMRELDAHPGNVDLWRARYEWDFGNHDRASEHIARARARESHPEIELRAAELAKALKHPDEARKAYENVLPRAPIPANLGLGWLALAEGRHAAARDHFQASLDAIAREPEVDGEEELHRLNGLVGVAITRAALGDCKGALAAVRDLPEPDQLRQLENGAPEIVQCAKRERAP